MLVLSNLGEDSKKWQSVELDAVRKEGQYLIISLGDGKNGRLLE